jgi:hypothetical protein
LANFFDSSGSGTSDSVAFLWDEHFAVPSASVFVPLQELSYFCHILLGFVDDSHWQWNKLASQ